MRTKTGRVRLMAIIAISALISAGCSGNSESVQKIDKPINVKVVDSSTLMDMLQKAQGNAVVLNFWATWCPPCVNEMRDLVQFNQTYAPKGVVFISVSVDHPDTVDGRVKPFAKDHELPFDVYVLSDRSPELIGKALGVKWEGSVPTTFIFDKHGKLIRGWFEEVTFSQLAVEADALL